MIEKNILEEIKQISLVDYLAYLGHHPKSNSGGRLFYLSPLHHEKTASFAVNTRTRFHSWADYGLSGNNGGALSGDIISFVQKYHNLEFPEAVQKLAEYHNLDIKPVVKMPTNDESILVEKQVRDSKYQFKEEKDIESKALIKYIESRKIDLEIAKKYCKEVHWTYHDKFGKLKEGYGIGLKNESRGYEISTQYGKFSIGQKTFSVVKAEIETKNWIVIEGKWDFQAYMTEKKYQSPPSNVLILNSVSFAVNAIEYLKKNGAEKVMSCHDCDRAGYTLIHDLKTAFGDNCYDMLHVYQGYKDYNDKIRDIKLPATESFLIEEKQNCKNWIIVEGKENLKTFESFIELTKNENLQDKNVILLQNVFETQKVLDYLKTKEVDNIAVAAAFSNHTEIKIIDKAGDIITQKFVKEYPNLEDLRVHYKMYQEKALQSENLKQQYSIQEQKAELTLPRAQSPHDTSEKTPPWRITEEEYQQKIKEISEKIVENLQKQKFDKNANGIETLRANSTLKKELEELRNPFAEEQRKNNLSYKEIVLGAERRGYEVPINILQSVEKHVPSFKEVSEGMFLLENEKTVGSHVVSKGIFMDEFELLPFNNNQAKAGLYFKKEDVEDILENQPCYIKKSSEETARKFFEKSMLESLDLKNKLEQTNKIKGGL